MTDLTPQKTKEEAFGKDGSESAHQRNFESSEA